MGTPNTISEVAICKLALSRIGASSRIASLDTTVDGSTEAAACSVWYPQDRDATLTDFPWPWAQGFVGLSQVNTVVPASPEYCYSYRYPAACLHITGLHVTPEQWSIVSTPQTTGTLGSPVPDLVQWWRRPEGNAKPWPFRINSDNVGRLVMTDLWSSQGVSAMIIQAVSDPTQFSADFVSLLAWRLAVDLSSELAIKEDRRTVATKMYEDEVGRARARLINESQSDIPWRRRNSEFVRARY